VRDIFCFFWGGEEMKWEAVVSAEKGANSDCIRRCDEEGMFVMYRQKYMPKKMSQFGDWKARRGTTNLNTVANGWKVIRAVVVPGCMM